MAESTSRNPVGLTFGFIAGVALVLFNVGLYLGGMTVYMSPMAWLGYLIVGGMAVWAGTRLKKRQGGFLSFGEGFRVVFAVFALSFLLLTLFNFILFNYLDIPFRDAYSTAVADKTTELLKSMKAPEDNIEEYRKGLMDPAGYKLSNLLMSFAMLCMIAFLPVSLIIALIMRKKKPPFENSFNQ
jgi:hypothetical protein